jgi:hypothetical protein
MKRTWEITSKWPEEGEQCLIFTTEGVHHFGWRTGETEYTSGSKNIYRSGIDNCMTIKVIPNVTRRKRKKRRRT